MICLIILCVNKKNVFLHYLVSATKENIKEDKHFSKGVRFHENCKVEDGGPSMKQVKKIPQPAILNTIVCPKFEDL